MAPATHITILVGAAGTGSLDQFLSATQGAITTADDPGDTAATLSTGALAGVNATTNISIAADATISFNDLGGTLSLQTGLGNSASFSATTGTICFSNTSNTLATAGGSIALSAGTNLTVASLNTTGGDITLIADGIVLGAGINAGTGIVTLEPFTANHSISLGGAGSATSLGLADSDFGNITARVVRVGSSAQTGAITVDGAINTHAGYNTLDLIATGAGGAITQTAGTIEVANLALQADAGIGASGALQVTGPIDVLPFNVNVAFHNATSGNVQVSSINAMTIAAVDQLDGTTGHTIGNFASGGIVTLSNNSQVNVNAAISSVGSINITSTGSDLGFDNGVLINADVSASGSGSTITVDAIRVVRISGTAKLATTSGAITITSAGTGAEGGVTMGPTTAIDTSAGNNTITVDGGQGDITLAVLDAGTGAVNVQAFGGSILDGNGAANNVMGGVINLYARMAAGINLDVVTDTPGTAGVIATAANAPIVLRSTSPLQVDSINAGAAGDVTLTVNNANTANSSITSLHPGDGIADVTGQTVTLIATGPSNGSTGQIGFINTLTSSVEFFEVAAGEINANTNNSQLWISVIGGAVVGSINSGTATANLEMVGGDLLGSHAGTTPEAPDITAGMVIFSSRMAPRSSSIGSATNPLLLQTANLDADYLTDVALVNVKNVAAGGDLEVEVTGAGDVNIGVAGGNLTTTGIGGAGTVTLRASGAVLNGPGVLGVQAVNLAVTAGAGVGTSADPLLSDLSGSLAAIGGTGVFVTNTSTSFPLDIGTVAGVSGITATSGDITITTNIDLTVSQPVSTTSVVTLTGDSANSAGNININAAITGSSAIVQGGTGNDTFTVTALSATPLHLDGLAGTNTLNFDGQGQHSLGTIPGELTISSTLKPLTYANIQSINLNNAASVDAFYGGPDTRDRGTALAGLTAAERFVQVLYLNALGRVGSKAEIDGWAAAFGGSSASNASIQAAIAHAIEGSREGRDHEVRSWYVQYLGRTAMGGEEMGWVNLLAAGQTEESVLSLILGSSEFFKNAQTLGFSGTADSQYVQALYALLMHRTASAGEVAAWVGALPTIGRSGAALDFLDSGEFRTDQFEGYYNALLHRPADSASRNAWVAAGLDVFTTRIDFETSSEFFSNG